MNDRKRTEDARPSGAGLGEGKRAASTDEPQSPRAAGEAMQSPAGDSTSPPKPKKQRRPKRQIRGSYL